VRVIKAWFETSRLGWENWIHLEQTSKIVYNDGCTIYMYTYKKYMCIYIYIYTHMCVYVYVIYV